MKLFRIESRNKTPAIKMKLNRKPVKHLFEKLQRRPLL